MKVIIAGSRHLDRYDFVSQAMSTFCARPGLRDSGHFVVVDEVVSGHCKGPDLMGERWAELHQVPVRVFPAAWNKHGRAAGPIRNREMAAYADALVLIWDGVSRGSANMLKEATARNLEVFVWIVDVAGRGHHRTADEEVGR